jgi:hypothetical protein
MDGLLALALVLVAAASLLRRAVRTFADPEAGSCAGSEGCASACAAATEPEPPLVQLELPAPDCN